MLGNEKMPNFDHLNDRVIADGTAKPSFSMRTNIDSKGVLEENPYFDKTKNYSEEELEKFKKFFGG